MIASIALARMYMRFRVLVARFPFGHQEEVLELQLGGDSGERLGVHEGGAPIGEFAFGISVMRVKVFCHHELEHGIARGILGVRCAGARKSACSFRYDQWVSA